MPGRYFAVSGLFLLSAAILSSCSPDGRVHSGDSAVGGDGGETDLGVPVDAQVDARGPSPACLVDGVSGNASIEIVPPYPRPGRQITFNVTSPEGYTTVRLLLCGPDGVVIPDGPEVYAGSPNLWVWNADSLAPGIYQARFSADPDDTIYKTLTFVVEDNPSDRDGDGYTDDSLGGDDCDDEDHTVHPGAVEVCGDSVDQDCNGSDLQCDYCNPPAGNILAHGEFEEGMSGLAPTGWEVRNPSTPGSCPGSPDSHVFLGPPAAGCTGNSLTIDAGGTWDCYAVQIVSDYFTIEAGHTYRISAVVRSQGNAVNPAAWFIIGVQWVDAGDSFFGDEKNPRPPTAQENDFDWKVLSFDLVAPAGATRILVWLTAHYPGRVDYDNIAVVRMD